MARSPSGCSSTSSSFSSTFLLQQPILLRVTTAPLPLSSSDGASSFLFGCFEIATPCINLYTHNHPLDCEGSHPLCWYLHSCVATTADAARTGGRPAPTLARYADGSIIRQYNSHIQIDTDRGVGWPEFTLMGLTRHITLTVQYRSGGWLDKKYGSVQPYRSCAALLDNFTFVLVVFHL